MKKKIILFISLLFINMLSLNAVSSSSVNYKIDNIISEVTIDKAGSIRVKEVIKQRGTFNGYIRDLVYKNDRLKEFDKDNISFENNSIYNGEAIDLISVGRIDNYDKELDYDIFDQEVTYFEDCSDKEKCYEESLIDNGISIKMYNETKNSSTYFYIEYEILNVVVNHSDVSELYYQFVGESFDDNINRYDLRILLPEEVDQSDLRVWAHGPLYGSVQKLCPNEEKCVGLSLSVDNLSKNTPVDARMLFPKDLITLVVEGQTKVTNTVATDSIVEVEIKRSDEANRLREKERLKIQIYHIITGVYLSLTLIIFIYVLLKHDREYKNTWNNEYYREFINDYDVTVIEYLFNKRITERAFSTSILNLIYKKKIKVQKLADEKNNYQFTLIDSDDVTKAENEIIKLLFGDIGKGNVVTLKQIKDYSKKITNDRSPYLSKYNKWKELVMDDAVKENFYENATTVKLVCGLYGFIGLLLTVALINNNILNISTLALFIVSIAFIIYIIAFTKRTRRGAQHFYKWKAFKRFLKDFGRFDEKELPEIALWERYLVYANILGVADKLEKEMKVKLDNIPDYERDKFTFYDYMLYSNLNTSLNREFTKTIETANYKQSQAIAKSASSSGYGGGGGFSSGGGFGGGGGGGRGF